MAAESARNKSGPLTATKSPCRGSGPAMRGALRAWFRAGGSAQALYGRARVRAGDTRWPVA